MGMCALAEAEEREVLPRFPRIAVCAVVVGVLLYAAARADVVSIPAAKDNTLYDSFSGDRSNGAGAHLFTGRTAELFNNRRRAVVAFDLTGVIPPESTLNSVSLRLFMSRTPTATATTTQLHRVLTDWGEGASDASGAEGTGAPAQPGDATWIHTFRPGSLWTDPGGDFQPAVSAAAAVGAVGFYTWSSDQMVDDVQFWIDNPALNFGWLLLGNETAIRTARRFDSRENPLKAQQPELIVDFTPPETFACCLLSQDLCLEFTVAECEQAGGITVEGVAECEGDLDGDGFDALCGDECPTDPNKVFPGECGCLQPDTDSDGDGFPNCVDGCPNDPEKTVPGVCGCGVDDDADNDGDNVPDCHDVCPGADDAVFAPECTGAIPTLSAWGVLVTALLLLVAGKIQFGRRTRAT